MSDTDCSQQAYAEAQHDYEYRKLEDEVTRLRARVAELEKDAARYRYLRRIDRSEEWEDLLVRRPIWIAEDIDAAIDAALSQQEGEG